MRCTVCDKDKEINQFQQYWHSTQNKMRIRKQCTQCLYDIRLKRKNPDKYYSKETNYKKCNTCNKWKNINQDFYYKNNGKKINPRCKECEKEMDRKDRLKYIQNNCGADRVFQKPNKYTDKYQKECTFNLMNALGYTYNEEYGIWTKPGVKEIRDGKPYFYNLIPKTKNKSIVTNKVIKQMIEYTNKGLNKLEISKIMGLSYATIYKYVRKYGEIN